MRVAQLAGREFFQECSGLIERGRRRLGVGSEHFDGNVESVGEGVKAADGDVAAAKFDGGEKARGQVGCASELVNSHATAGADGANIFAELEEV